MAIQFQKEHANHKTGSLVPIHKWVIAHDTGNIGSSHIDDIGAIGIGIVLSRTCQSGLK